jgi:hypothetical protein
MLPAMDSDGQSEAGGVVAHEASKVIRKTRLPHIGAARDRAYHRILLKESTLHAGRKLWSTPSAFAEILDDSGGCVWSHQVLQVPVH